GHFAPPGSALDREARLRGTSVYLPQRVLPMFPEIISNSLASLQQGRVRYVKSAIIDFAPHGQKTGVRFANGTIRVRRRFHYDTVPARLSAHDGSSNHPHEKKGGKKHTAAPALEPELMDMLLRMRELAMILRQRRIKRGSLQLSMPEVELEYDEQGRVKGAH